MSSSMNSGNNQYIPPPPPPMMMGGPPEIGLKQLQFGGMRDANANASGAEGSFDRGDRDRHAQLNTGTSVMRHIAPPQIHPNSGNLHLPMYYNNSGGGSNPHSMAIRRSNSLPNSDSIGLGDINNGSNPDNLGYDYDCELDKQVGPDVIRPRPRVSSFGMLGNNAPLLSSSSAYAVHPLGVDLNNADLTHEGIRTKPRSSNAYNVNASRGGRWTGKGESLNPEAAVHFMVNERQRMEEEYAQLRIENQKLKSELISKNRVSSNGLDIHDRPNSNMKQQPTASYHQQQQQQLNSGNYSPLNPNQYPQQQHLNTPPPNPPKPYIPESSLSDLQALSPVIVPEKLWRGGALWKIPFNGKGPPELRHVCIKRSFSISQQSSAAMLYLGSTLGHIRKANITDDLGNALVQDQLCDIPTVTFPLTLMWLSVRDPETVMNRLSNPQDNDNLSASSQATNDDLANARELILYHDSYLVVGHKSAAFAKMISKNNPVPPPQLCFSIVTASRSLDLATEDEASANEWIQALTVLLSQKSISNMLNTPGGMKQPSHQSNDKFFLSLGLGSPADPSTYSNSSDNNTIGGKFDSSNSNNNSSSNSNNGAKLPIPPSAAYNNAPPPPQYNNQSNNSSINNTISNNNNNSSNILPPAPPLNPNSFTQADSWKMSREQYLRKKQEDLTRQMFESAFIGDIEGIESALRFGIPVNTLDPTTSDTPLLIACKRGFVKIVEICLEYGAKNDPHPDFGQTALHIAVQEGHIEIARTILNTAAESSADSMICNLTDSKGQLPLHIAAEKGFDSIAELLIHHGSELSYPDENQQTGLHLAAANGYRQCLATLLDHDGDELIDYPDALGNTALHLAALYGHLSCVRLLCETAATVSVLNNGGQSPFMLANSRGHHQIALLLQDYMGGNSSINNNKNGPIMNSNSNFNQRHNIPVNQSYPPPRMNMSHGLNNNLNPHSSGLKVTTDDSDRDRTMEQFRRPQTTGGPMASYQPTNNNSISNMKSNNSNSNLPRPFASNPNSVSNSSSGQAIRPGNMSNSFNFSSSTNAGLMNQNNSYPNQNSPLLRSVSSTPDKMQALNGNYNGASYHSPGFTRALSHGQPYHHGGSLSARDTRDRTYSHSDVMGGSGSHVIGGINSGANGTGRFNNEGGNSSLSLLDPANFSNGFERDGRAVGGSHFSYGEGIIERGVYSPLSARERPTPSLIGVTGHNNNNNNNNNNNMNSTGHNNINSVNAFNFPPPPMSDDYRLNQWMSSPNSSNSNSNSNSNTNNGINKSQLTPNGKQQSQPSVPFYSPQHSIYSGYQSPVPSMSLPSPHTNLSDPNRQNNNNNANGVGSSSNSGGLSDPFASNPPHSPVLLLNPNTIAPLANSIVTSPNPSNLPRPGRAGSISTTNPSSTTPTSLGASASAAIGTNYSSINNSSSLNSNNISSANSSCNNSNNSLASMIDSSNVKTGSDKGGLSNNQVSSPNSSNASITSGQSDYITQEESAPAACSDIFDGYLEKFDSYGVTWYSYRDDASDCVYFLDSTYRYNTQWEDPREYGITSTPVESGSEFDPSNGNGDGYGDNNRVEENTAATQQHVLPTPSPQSPSDLNNTFARMALGESISSPSPMHHALSSDARVEGGAEGGESMVGHYSMEPASPSVFPNDANRQVEAEADSGNDHYIYNAPINIKLFSEPSSASTNNIGNSNSSSIIGDLNSVPNNAFDL